MPNKQSKPKMYIRMGKQKQDISFLKLFDLYEKDCKLRNITEVTIKGYKYATTYFLRYAGEGIMCSDVTQELINNYMVFLAQDKKPQTVNSYVFKISPIVLYGVDKGYITQKIEFTHMVEQERFKDIYSEEELKILLTKPKSNSFHEYRAWVIINMFVGTGMRSQELRDLQVQDIDLESGIVNLRHTKNKHPRLIPLTDTLINILEEYLEIRGGEPDDALFCSAYGEPLQRTTLQNSIQKYNRRRGIDKTSIHLFRHTFITMAVRSGVSPLLLKRITGHTSMKQLDNYYQHNISDLTEIMGTVSAVEKLAKKERISMRKPRRGKR